MQKMQLVILALMSAICMMHEWNNKTPCGFMYISLSSGWLSVQERKNIVY